MGAAARLLWPLGGGRVPGHAAGRGDPLLFGRPPLRPRL